MKKKTFIFLGILTALLLAFNNCGRGDLQFSDHSSSGANGYKLACDGQLMAGFQRTYHSFLVQNCQGCHSGAHGSADLSVSFKAFSSRGAALIDYQATHAHGGNNFGPSMQASIDAFKPSWRQAESDYLECMSRGASSFTSDGPVLSAKVPDKKIPNLMGTLNNNSWVPVEWDLESEIGDVFKGRLQAVLRLEARIHKINNLPAGLLIRNPSLRLKPTSPNLEVFGLMIYLDGVKQTSVTTYSGVYQIIASRTNSPLAPDAGSAYATYSALNGDTLLSIEFNEVRPTAQPPPVALEPTPKTPEVVPIPVVPVPGGGVKFSELNNSNSPYRVFNRSCTGCHNSGSGRLDLTNYDAARAAATLITQRMGNAASPMPPSGLLRQNDRDLVQSWVNAGAPR